jgi:hypothetical protein
MISCILCTARDEYPIIGLPEVHVLQPTFYSLEKQTFKDFEVVVVDALYPKKRAWIEDRKWSFPVKYVPVHENHRFWLDHKRWNVCGQLNTGILYAEGELLVRIDDCAEVPPDFLERFWTGYEQGYFPLAMHTRYRNGQQAYYTEEYRQHGYEFHTPQAQEILEQFYNKGQPIRDTRWPVVEQKGRMIAPPLWYYGYSSVSLDAALKVNGYNELFDGDKGQEDQEMGLRLSMAGYRDLFLLDVNHWVIEHEHLPIPQNVIVGGKTAKCNYGLYQLSDRKRRWRANSEALSLEDCLWIREETCPRCGNYQRCLGEELKGRFFEDSEEFRLWLNDQPIFDLREERMNL